MITIVKLFPPEPRPIVPAARGRVGLCSGSRERAARSWIRSPAAVKACFVHHGESSHSQFRCTCNCTFAQSRAEGWINEWFYSSSDFYKHGYSLHAIGNLLLPLTPNWFWPAPRNLLRKNRRMTSEIRVNFVAEKWKITLTFFSSTLLRHLPTSYLPDPVSQVIQVGSSACQVNQASVIIHGQYT